MPKFDNYFVVEFRIPIRVDDSSSVHEAISKANRICQRQHGFKPDNWYARVFEYTTGEDVAGPFKEYFYNPYSATYREITKNHGYHNDMIKAGLSPEDGFDYKSVSDKLGIDEEVKFDIEEYDDKD